MRRLCILLPKMARVALWRWKENGLANMEDGAKRGKMLKLLGWMANFKPHVYFLMWKKRVFSDKVNDLNEEIQKEKRKTRTAMAGVKLNNSKLPILRLAFSKLLGPGKGKPLKALAMIMHRNGEFNLKLACDKLIKNVSMDWYKTQLEGGLAAIAKRPKIIDGCLKLGSVVHRRPK
jgi:hypothetical protein